MTAKCIEHREHPMLFSAPMVRALLADRKHVTRRLSERWLKVKAGDRLWVRETWAATESDCDVPVISYRAGGYMIHGATGEKRFGTWKDEIFPGEAGQIGEPEEWRPSLFMPRWASRITLEVEEDARMERLQDITDEEAKLEGVQVLPLQSEDDPSAWWQVEPGEHQERTPRASFRSLWSSLHTKPGERWEDNPMVVRVGRFRRAPNA